MKIDQIKEAANQNMRRIASTDLRNSTGPGSAESAAMAEGDFSSIFKSLVNRETDKDESLKDKNSRSDIGREEKTASDGDHKKITEKQEDDNSGSEADGETFAGMAAMRAQLKEAQIANLENVNARAILHIADLERIVSSVRTQLNEHQLPQITIQLKNSVLEGLQIKLSNDPNGKLIAEFLSSSERVKLLIDSKSKELADILQGRGLQIGSIKASLADAGGGGKDSRRGEDEKIASPVIDLRKPLADEPKEPIREVTSNNTYRV